MLLVKIFPKNSSKIWKHFSAYFLNSSSEALINSLTTSKIPSFNAGPLAADGDEYVLQINPKHHKFLVGLLSILIHLII